MGKLNVTNPQIEEGYVYDLSGNMLVETVYTESDNKDPLAEHIYLGNRLIATITGMDDLCVIATTAYGTPMAGDIGVFRAFRDRVLKKTEVGSRFVDWYYREGPGMATWLKAHDRTRGAVYVGLVVLAVPMKAVMFGHWGVLILIFAGTLAAFVVVLRRKRSKKLAVFAALAVAIILVIVYSMLLEVPMAQAYSETPDQSHYYYTTDHVMRPFSLRNEDMDLTWYEQHYPFGEVIEEEVACDTGCVLDNLTPMVYGGGTWETSWKPNFRFPGQYEDGDGYPFVQNHYRDYLPGFGRYNRVDPISSKYISINYSYAMSNPISYFDNDGLIVIVPPISEYPTLEDMKCMNFMRGFVSAGYIGETDDYLHCLTSCYFVANCKVTRQTAELAGVFKEIWDIIGPGDAEFNDLVSNRKGVKCASKGDCESCCCPLK